MATLFSAAWRRRQRSAQSASEIVRALDAIITRSDETLIGLRPASRPIVRRAGPLIAVLLIAAVAFALIQRRRGETAASANTAVPRSVAVLPFANVGSDTADAYFADGMSEELATALSKVRGLRVVARIRFRSGERRRPELIRESSCCRPLLAEPFAVRVTNCASVQLTRTAMGLLWGEQDQAGE